MRGFCIRNRNYNLGICFMFVYLRSIPLDYGIYPPNVPYFRGMGLSEKPES